MRFATRLRTVLPVLRILLLVTIVTAAALTVLSSLGVNTTTVLAGTSILGLAISFGSQSLVHDIVSGAFYMADDAFRIGEYIDTGSLKGTVEGISMRSLRLRHQDGQVHTIPFGQIRHVTNFSRDWQTIKFNLQLAHGTDIEKVRKAVKQVGADMMSDPEFGPQIIQPLKLQGVACIDPNAVVVRLKFTAHPFQPTLIQREALKRLYAAFNERRIAFAANTVLEVLPAPEALPGIAARTDAGPSLSKAPEHGEPGRPELSTMGLTATTDRCVPATEQDAVAGPTSHAERDSSAASKRRAGASPSR